MPHLSRRAVLAVGFILGLAVWLLPTVLLGESEPWDGHGPAYPLTLLLIGLALGFLGPGRPGATVAGVFAGQFAVLLFRVVTNPGSSELWMVGVVLLGGYTFVATGIGALIGSSLRRRLHPPSQTAERRVADRRA